MNLAIDSEFQAAMFPLAAEERRQLEENIIAEGCLDPLKVWRGLVVDGHNRFEICSHHGIAYGTVDLMLAERADVLNWIDKNQLGRRNLTEGQRNMLMGRVHNRRKKAIPNPVGIGGKSGKVVDCQNVTQQSTAAQVAEEFGVSERTVLRNAAAVAAIEPRPALTAAVQAGNLALSVAVQAAELPDEVLDEVLASPEPAKAVKAHVAHNSGNNEWYTPSKYVEAARTAMGSIDCDPASCEIANRTVKAPTYYTIETNGLEKVWRGNVWMNPPYSQPLIAEFARGLIARYLGEEISQACVLVNNATETEWFQCISIEAAAVCFLRTRVKFLDPKGNATGMPLQGQAILYLGNNASGFEEAFSEFGDVWVRP